MKLISPHQCRAARVLLDMKQAELAERANISPQSLGAFENGTSTPRTGTIQTLRTVLEQAGLRFLENDGVQRSAETVTVLQGRDANRRMLEDVYHSLKHKGGEVLISGLTEISEAQGDDYAFLQYHLARLKEANITERILICEGDSNLVAPAHWYRQVPKAYFPDTTFQIYGEKIALVAWGQEQTITVIQNRLFKRAFEKLFNFVWDRATPVHDRESE